MPSNIRRQHPALRLNERVLGPVRHLARLAGVSPKEIIEFLLTLRPAPARRRW
ncbi:MAG TPA: hypothetical protein VFW70_04925 [Methylomirabilota bacterium]|nr:hypothetical protein [Methylomirabilota bacterium]